MIKEAYVSFEVAKLLKEKGFNEATNRHYNAQYDEIRTVSDTFMTYWNSEEHMKVLMMEGAIAIPTHQMAMAWLREVHKVLIVIDAYHADHWDGYIDSFEIRIYSHASTIIVPNEIAHHTDYTEAVEAALKYSLANLI